ncbi:MAG: PLDc N-terminal domain-containing protein [Coprothermobacterota bacterium]|nr:PLDc N-terminal domain-containing protein [Coprothermobacterota bacterium]
MEPSLWLWVAPLILIELGLLFVALRDLLRRRPPLWVLWLVAVIFFQVIGPALYLLIGRKEDDGTRYPDP